MKNSVFNAELPRQSSSNSNFFNLTSPVEQQQHKSDRLRHLRQSLMALEIGDKRQPSSYPDPLQTNEAHQSPQKTKWTKMLEKIQFKPKDNEYDNLPFKPGIDMYRALFDQEAFPGKLPVKALKIRVPETAAVFSNLYWITYNYARGQIETKVNFRLQDFYDNLKKINKTIYFKDCEPQDAAVIVRQQGSAGSFQGSKIVMTWNDVKERMNAGIDSNSLVQQFVFVHGTKPSFFRLHYFNPFASSLKRNYGYFISNKASMQEQAAKERTLTERMTVCTEREHSFEVFVLRGKVISIYEDQTQSLIDYLSQSYRFRIQEIVVDFLKDERNNVFFLNVRAFKIDRPIPRQLKPSARQGRDKPHNLVKCSLCKHIFAKSQTTRVLTLSMLHNFLRHLAKRGVFSLHELTPPNHRNNSCRVCDLCYMLVVAEHELIELEQQFAGAVNIPSSLPSDTKQLYPTCTADSFGCELQQWRLMFYIQNIYDLNFDELPRDQDLYLQLRYLNYTTKFKLQSTGQAFQVCIAPATTEQTEAQKSASQKLGVPEINTIQSETEDYTNPAFIHKTETSEWQGTSSSEESEKPILLHSRVSRKETQPPNYQYSTVKVNKIRLHYFFGSEVAAVRQFLTSVELDLRLTAGPDWNSILAMGSCVPFVHFQLSDGFEVGRERLQVHLFSQTVRHFFLNVSEIDSSDVLWSRKRHQNQGAA